MILYEGKKTCFQHYAIDNDNDSLSFEFTDIGNGPQTFATWLPAYSAQQPLSSNPPVSFNSLTGEICMTPNTQMLSPTSVIIKQWRTINNTSVILAGTTTRDMQIKVIACTNSIPVLGGIDKTLIAGYNPADTIFNAKVCLGSNFCFNIWGFDADTFNALNTGNPEKFSITWNNGIPAASFTVFNDGSDSAYANFSWTPTQADVSIIPKCFLVTITDSACPYHASQTFQYCITVRGMLVNIGNDTLICHGETLTVTADADTTTKNYTWLVNGNITGAPNQSTFVFNSVNYGVGTYTVGVLTDDGSTTVNCPGADNITVVVIPLPQVNLGNDTLLCEGNSLTLNAGPGQLYVWNTGHYTQIVTLSQPASQVFWVVVDGGNGTRCMGSDSINVEIVAMPVFNLGEDTCLQTPLEIEVSGLNNMYQWYFEWSTGSTDSHINISTSGVYTVTVTNKPNSGCEAVKNRIVNIVDMNEWQAENSEITVSAENSLFILNAPAAPANHTYDYKWYVDGIYAGNNQFFALSGLKAGKHLIILKISGGCEASIEVKALDYLTAYPNPSGNKVFYLFSELSDYYVTVYDISGKIVLHQNCNSGQCTVYLNNVSSGIFFYTIKDSKGAVLKTAKLDVAD
jgi:hypothetical protein